MDTELYPTKSLYYHTPTKLWKDNVLTGIWLFPGGPHVSITHDVLYLTVQAPVPPPNIRPVPPKTLDLDPSSDIWW